MIDMSHRLSKSTENNQNKVFLTKIRNEIELGYDRNNITLVSSSIWGKSGALDVIKRTH